MAVHRETRRLRRGRAVYVTLAVLVVAVLVVGGQYGITGRPGTAAGQLNIPDGFDLLLPDGSTPTHPATG
jgi:hypothetical protein